MDPNTNKPIVGNIGKAALNIGESQSPIAYTAEQPNQPPVAYTVVEPSQPAPVYSQPAPEPQIPVPAPPLASPTSWQNGGPVVNPYADAHQVPLQMNLSNAPIIQTVPPKRAGVLSALKAGSGALRFMAEPSRLLVIPLVLLLVTGTAVGYVMTHSKTVPEKTTPKSAPKVAVAPPTPTVTTPVVPAPATPAPAPAPAPAPKPAPKPAPPPPAPLPTLPSVAGKDTSYSLGVLVIKYFPLTANGQNIDINVTGDVGDSYSYIRQHTTDVTNNLVQDLPNATSYQGYFYNNAPSLTYHVVNTIEHTTAAPINSTLHAGFPTYADYPGIMNSHNICNYVNNQGVREVWLWAYQGPSTQGPNHDQPYLNIAESKMSGPYGDISNSYRWNDMPVCQHTYVVYTFNYGRGTAEAMESWGHQIEMEDRNIDNNLFTLFQGQNYPQTLGVTGRCGSVHNPPNARNEYDRNNPTPTASDCFNWNPDGMGPLTQISCANWGCGYTSDNNNSSLNYMVWNWRSMPGRNNTKTYQGKQLRNWWDVHGNFDSVMGSSKRLTL